MSGQPFIDYVASQYYWRYLQWKYLEKYVGMALEVQGSCGERLEGGEVCGDGLGGSRELWGEVRRRRAERGEEQGGWVWRGGGGGGGRLRVQ